MSQPAPEPMSNQDQRYLIICERDVGLFSLIQQVIANIPRALSEGRIPIVSFGSGCSYYTPDGYEGRDNVWEYYFEPVVAGLPAAAIPPNVAARVAGTHPHAPPAGYKINRSYFASSNFGDHPDLAGKVLEIPWKWDDPSDTLRRTAAPIIEQYIRPRDYIVEKVNRFFDQHLAGGPVIGVQIRGTDSISKAETRAFRFGSLQPSAYFTAIERHLRVNPEAKLFVATDAASSLEFMKKQFGDRVVAYDSLRQGAVPAAAGRGPLGGLLPAYIAGKPNAAARNGEEAVIEYLLLCRCDLLVHNGASLARTVLLARPDVPHVRTNPPKRIRGHLYQLYWTLQRSVTGDGTNRWHEGSRWNRLALVLEQCRIAIGDFFENRRDPNRPLMRLVLWCTDHIRRILLRNPYVLVIARHNNEYLRKRKKQRNDVKPTVLEIRNDFDYNSGFCVQIQFVLGQLQMSQGCGLQPVVNLDQKFGYFYDPTRGTNMWEYYFEPVAEMSSDELETLAPEFITRYPPPKQLSACLGDKVYPRLEGPQTVHWYARRRREGAQMLRKYVHVKPHVLTKMNEFFERQMKDQPVLGVQLRGTDKAIDPNGRPYGFPAYMARIVPPQEYWPLADEFIVSYPDCKIFVATDQQQFLEMFREQYPGRVLSYGDTRSSTSQNSMHAKDGRNYNKGEDVLIDCLLLSRTDFLLRCQSNVGEVATYFNRDLPVIDVQYSRLLQDVELKIRDRARCAQR